jgi:hypothetical protein
MEDSLPKKILDHHPGGRRKPHRPRKRWLDDVTKDLACDSRLDEAGLGQEMGEICRRGQGLSWIVTPGNSMIG